MRTKSYKRIMAMVLSGAMLIGGAVSVHAEGTTETTQETFPAPTEPMAVDDEIITASAHRAASVLPEVLGLNTKCGFSMINGSMPADLKDAQTKLMLGAFGTDYNTSPDPYYYNYFYNFYADENGLTRSADAVMIPENNIAASPVKADTTVLSNYGTSISLAGRPDILIGCSSGNTASDLTGYNSLITQIRNGEIGEAFAQSGDASYDPYLIGYSTSTTYDMVTTLKATADAMVEIEEDTGKHGRYGDPVAIANNFGDYVCGISTYVLSELERTKTEKKDVAIVQKINSDGTFVLADAASKDATSSVRGVEYLALVSNNIASTVDDINEVSAEELLTADAIILSASNGGGGDDMALPNDREGLIAALKLTYGTDAETTIKDKNVVDANPETVYGVTQNSIENGMGYGYFIGRVYPEIVNPAYMCAYFYENFLHVKTDKLQEVINVTFGSVSDVDYSLEGYTSASVASKLAAGKAYYYENINELSQYALSTVWGANGIADGYYGKYSTVSATATSAAYAGAALCAIAA